MDDAQRFDIGRYRHWTEDQVRFSDLDPLGHVNNNAIGQYFENARAELFREITPLWPHGDQIFILARTAIDFRHELHRPARLRIGTSVLGMGRTSMTLANALFQEQGEQRRGIAYCESVSVLIDGATRQPIAVPDTLRRIVAAYMATPEAAHG